MSDTSVPFPFSLPRTSESGSSQRPLTRDRSMALGIRSPCGSPDSDKPRPSSRKRLVFDPDESDGLITPEFGSEREAAKPVRAMENAPTITSSQTGRPRVPRSSTSGQPDNSRQLRSHNDSGLSYDGYKGHPDLEVLRRGSGQYTGRGEAGHTDSQDSEESGAISFRKQAEGKPPRKNRFEPIHEVIDDNLDDSLIRPSTKHLPPAPASSVRRLPGKGLTDETDHGSLESLPVVKPTPEDGKKAPSSRVTPPEMNTEEICEVSRDQAVKIFSTNSVKPVATPLVVPEETSPSPKSTSPTVSAVAADILGVQPNHGNLDSERDFGRSKRVKPSGETEEPEKKSQAAPELPKEASSNQTNPVWCVQENWRCLKKGISSFHGTILDGRFDGHCRLSFKDGSEFEGEFKEGCREGPGKLSWPDGTTAEGTFRADLPIGDFKARRNDTEVSGKLRDDEVFSEHRLTKFPAFLLKGEVDQTGAYQGSAILESAKIRVETSMANGVIDPQHPTEVSLTDAPLLSPNPLQGRFILSDDSEVGLLRTLANGTYLIDFAAEKLHKFGDN